MEDMKIDVFVTPFFRESDDRFADSIIVMIDVLRASTTVCSALFNGAKEVIASDTLDKAVRIYSSLSKESRFIGGERNGVKPDGFDAGNSPLEYTPEKVAGKTVILTTTNGTRIFQTVKHAKSKIIAGFVNISAVVEYLDGLITDENSGVKELAILCAGNNGNLSYEDTLCAGAIIKKIVDKRPEVYLTDSADACKNLYFLHADDLEDFLHGREHCKELEALGFHEDITTCLTYDYYPVTPILVGSAIKSIK